MSLWKIHRGHLEEDKKEPKFYKISNVTGDVVIHVTGYGKAVIGRICLTVLIVMAKQPV